MNISNEEILRLIDQWERLKPTLLHGPGELSPETPVKVRFIQRTVSQASAAALALVAANPGVAKPVRMVRYNPATAELLNNIGTRLSVAAHGRNLDAGGIDAVAKDPVAATPQDWLAADLALGKLKIIAADPTPIRNARNPNPVDWGNLCDEVAALKLPADLAAALEWAHRAARRAAFLASVVIEGNFSESRIRDIGRFCHELWDALRLARKNFMEVESELIAVCDTPATYDGKQLACAHSVALRFAQFSAAASVSVKETKLMPTEQWTAIGRRMLASSAVDPVAISEAMKREAVKAAKARNAAEKGAGDAVTKKLESRPIHSEDFTSVNWFGTEYSFTLGVQSLSIKALWKQWKENGLGLHQATIALAIDSNRDNFRIDKAFRNHPALGAMIQKSGDGKYKLAEPDLNRDAPIEKKKKSAGIPSKSRNKPR